MRTMSAAVWRVLDYRNYDPLHLFACHQALVDVSDDDDNGIREIAELPLQPGSPRPQRESRGIFPR